MIHRTALAVAAAVLALPVCIRAEVDVELAAKSKIKGSISPDGDADTFRFEASRASTVALTIKAKKGLDPAVVITGPGAADVPLSEAAKLVDQGRKLVVRGLALPSHGDYTLVVSGAGSGDYTLKLNVVPAKVLKTSFALAGLEVAQLVAPAPDGADVVFTVKAARGSPVVPELLDQPKAASASLKLEDVSGPGDVAVDVRNVNGDGGDVDLVVKIKAPKSKTQKRDVRGGAAAAVKVESEAGGVVEVGEGDLAGSGVDVPPGALDGDTIISVSSTTNVDVPDGGNAPAGPTVEFGPSGLTFSTPATVTIPYDPNAIPEGESAAGVLRVVRRESDGSQVTLDPESVDTDAGTVTVQTSGFSKFRAFVPAGRPALSDREFWLAEFSVGLDPDSTGTGDSRARRAAVAVGTVSLGEQGVANDSTVDVRGYEIEFGHDGSPQNFSQQVDHPFENGTFTWSYDGDGQTVTLTDSAEGGPTSFFVSEDGRFLAPATNGDPADLEVRLSLLCRKPDEPLIQSDLAGEWWAFRLFLNPADSPVARPLDLALTRASGTLSVAADGTGAFSGGYLDRVFSDEPRWRSELDREDDEFGLVLDTSPGPLQGTALLEGEFRMMPADGGDVLIGVSDQLSQSVAFAILVRKSSGASRASLAGARSNSGLFIDPQTTYEADDPQGLSVLLPDFGLRGSRLRLDIDAGGRLTLMGGEGIVIKRDTTVSLGVRREASEPDALGPRVTVSGAGRLGSASPGNPLDGAMSPDGVFAVGLAPLTAKNDFGFDISLRLPPETTSPAK